MALSPQLVQDAFDAALSDLNRYLNDLAMSTDRLGPWKEAANELSIDLNPLSQASQYVDFLGEMSNWVDAHTQRPVFQAAQYSNSLMAIRSLSCELNKLVCLHNKPQKIDEVLRAEQFRTGFAPHVAATKTWRINFTPAPAGEDWLKRSGFASWLVVSHDASGAVRLHVVYDVQKLNESSKEILDVEHRYEKVFAHEWAHARLQLPFFLKRIAAGERRPMARPSDEHQCWLYVGALRGAVVGLLVQLDRISGTTDNGWLA